MNFKNTLNYDPKLHSLSEAILKVAGREHTRLEEERAAQLSSIVKINENVTLNLIDKTIHIKEGIYNEASLNSFLMILKEKTKPKAKTCGTCADAMCEKCEKCKKCEENNCKCDMITENQQETKTVYVNIYFAQEHNADDAMDILKNKGVIEAAKYMAQWETGEEEEEANAPWGTSDILKKVTLNGENYVVSFNKGLPYISLVKVLSKTEDVEDETSLKEEMVNYLKTTGQEADDFDIEAAIYWFANDYYDGQTSTLYSILSTSQYRPGASIGSVEEEPESVKMLYKSLEEKFK